MQVIVFDFFGVICSEIAPFVLPKFLSKDDAAAYKATIVCDADLGRITQNEMFEKLSMLAHAPPKRLEADFWSFVRIDGEMVKLIEGLRPRYRTAMLTNAIVPFFRQVTAKYDLERLFETILVSSEEGLAKPDPAFYTLLVKRMAVRPEDCLFTDDNEVNLDGARAAGMKALLFEGADKLRRDLASIG
jgi:epoxide hydrolase-like predicted phosphatase